MRLMRHLTHWTALLAMLAAPVAPAWSQSRQLLEYPSIRSPVVGTRGMVVSQNEIATQVGIKVLRAGGNAIDASVAVAFALAVTLPRAGNIGGDGFMTIYDAKSGQTSVIDFRGVAPLAARLEMFVDDKGEETRVASFGYKAPDVPGTVSGLELAHRKHGKLPWAKLVEPAIALAADGVVLSPDEAFVFSWGKERLSVSESGRRTFYKPDGSLYVAGEVMKQPELAWSLREIARDGAKAFYTGEIAKRIAADMAKHGGLITLADLAAYKAVERAPLEGSYRDVQIKTVPPASAGGATLLEILNILENFDLASMPLGSAQSLHVMSEAMKIGYIDRYRHLGDTDFVRVPLKGFTSKAFAAERAKKVSLTQASKRVDQPAGDPWAHESPNTTHFSVVDDQGNAVSFTYTLGADFGSGVMIEGTGILMNNQMNNFDHESAWRAIRAGQPLPPNAMAPGKRMLSTMVPSILFKDGKPWLIVGTPGGGTIITTVVQIIVNTVDYKLNVAEATHHPRIFQNNTDTLQVEPNFNPDTLALLKAKGHRIRSDQTMGSAQSIMIENGLILGGADPRRPGALAVAQ
ncbi:MULTISPECIES: gamma-glutamyltransferase [unclassified Sphingomonas]|uniref:gamma-glutamyltransferase n=1 Tax=unclassified Sphingomonas TaxID=196159 RepID=UPI0008371EB1|nr:MULTISPECIES: gamma-glutamyltransferase [unclassified Sphingomonas]